MSERESAIQGPYQTGGRGLRALTLAATVATVLLVAVGALVRATGSGDACPDWPSCLGRLVPPLEYHTLIEYGHRLTASVSIALIAALAVLAVARYRGEPRILWTSVAALALVVAQAALGGVVVVSGLNAALVTAHLATAMALVGVLVGASVAARTAGASPGPADGLVWLARTVAAAAFALLLVGATVRAEGAGLAFRDWPLMEGSILPALGSFGRILQFAHRLLALALVPLVAWLAVRARRGRAGAGVSRAPFAFAALAGALLILEVGAGAFLVRTRLAAAAVVAHVTLAALVWATLVAAAATARVTAPVRGRRERSAGDRDPAAAGVRVAQP